LESSLKPRDLVLLLIGEGKDRRGFGRTSLQKLAFFASLRLEKDLGFRPHLYGPYSDVIEDEVETLQLSGLIEEKVQNLGFTSPTGFLAKKYDYELTESGEARIQALRTAYEKESHDISSLVVQVDQEAGGLDAWILAPAAKTLLIGREEGRSLSSEEVRQLATELGWELSDQQVGTVAHMLEGLGFLQLA
jgi:uncharacterized protein YwgA